jgi:hypothetical protein
MRPIFCKLLFVQNNAIVIREFIASQFKRPAGLLGIWSSNKMVKNNQKNYDRLIMDLDLQPQDKLLEIGYGQGIGVRMTAERCSTCTIRHRLFPTDVQKSQ